MRSRAAPARSGRPAPNGSTGSPPGRRPDDTKRDRREAGTVAGASRSGAVSLCVIDANNNPGVEDSAGSIRFYERAYSHDARRGGLYARWRALSAVGKADHVVELCRRAASRPRDVSTSAAATARCCASCTGAASGGRSPAWRSPTPAVEIARARARARRDPASTTAATAIRGGRSSSSASSRTCSSTFPTRRPAGGGGTRAARGRLRGAAGGQPLGAARGQARARRGGRAPAAALARGAREIAAAARA